MTVRLDRRDGVATITMDRPEKRNAMTDEMWALFESHLRALDTGGADRVLVVTGAGGAFCGGSDVTGLLDDPSSMPRRIDVSNRCVLAMHDLPIPTVALVDGVAAGSGANLALACDLVIATQRSRFAQLFIHRGLSLDSGASWLLPRLVGERRARELALLGQQVPASDALDMGMITRVVGDDALAAVGGEVVDTLLGHSPIALAGNKKLLDASWSASLAQALDAERDNQLEVLASAAAQQQISSFGKS
ncbi:MAG: enoyl-CoA hydratase [Gordonia sp. (in: high G+C Gram-positive bacteria)]|nr:MAG: enoyl-CoA hydratase [Gordonia sp. (in: high G+C Gram-positive bacteria)]